MDTKPPQSQRGIVAFFDILGYQNFCDNCGVSGPVSEVLGFLSSLGDKIKTEIIAFFPSHHKSVQPIVESLGCLLVSDSIILYMETPLGVDVTGNDEKRRWLIFILSCQLLYRRLFEFGLPSRGAIAFGDFIVHKAQCFAGRPLMDAYRLGQSINLSACVLHPSAATEWTRVAAKFEIQAAVLSLAFKHLIPTKLKEEHLWVINPFPPFKGSLIPYDSSNVRQFVLDAFWKHKKDIPHEVVPKIDNTEMLFRFVLKVANEAKNR